MAEHAPEQVIVNSNIDTINQLTGQHNPAYTIYNKFPQAEADGSHIVLAKGTDNKVYQIQIRDKQPFVVTAKQIVLLD
jgi:hypothetical protein